MTGAAPQRLRERYVEALVSAWPEHVISEDDLRSCLTLDATVDDDGGWVCSALLGTTSRLPFDTEAEAIAAVEADARSTAEGLKIDQ